MRLFLLELWEDMWAWCDEHANWLFAFFLASYFLAAGFFVWAFVNLALSL